MMENSWPLPSEPEIPNAATVAAMKESFAGGLASFNSVSELMADLNAPD
jgi:DNA-damage-inducible protein J